MDKAINGVESYPCPWCGYYDLFVQKNGMKNVQHPGGECFVMCDNCGATGPKAKTVDEAIQKWNDCSKGDGEMTEDLEGCGIQAASIPDELIRASEEASKNGVALMHFKDGSCGVIRQTREEKHVCYYCGRPAYIRKILIGDDDDIHWLCDKCNAKHNAMLDNAKKEAELSEELRNYAEAHGCGYRDIPIRETPGGGMICKRVYEPVQPLPCIRDEHGEIKRQTVKALFTKINEELDELKAAVLSVFYSLDVVPSGRTDLKNIGADEMPSIASEAADVKTAITTLEEALGIGAEMRGEAIRRVNAKNRERGRL